jgi:hypothetical protein
MKEREMAINAQVHVERRLLEREPTGNTPSKDPPFANDYFHRLAFLNPSSVTLTGSYEKIVKLPRPVKSWHKSSRGATDRFKGCLAELFPELKDLDERELKGLERKRHEF